MTERNHSVKRTEEIFDAAEQVFANFGFDKARIEEIARIAGVGKGTIYLYFQSKHELLVSLIEVRLGGFIALLENRIGAATDIEVLLRTLATTSVEFYINHASILNLLFQTAGQFPVCFQDRILSTRQRVIDLSTSAITSLLPVYRIEPYKLSVMIFGSINALMVEYILTGIDANPEEIADLIVDVYLSGIWKYKESG